MNYIIERYVWETRDDLLCCEKRFKVISVIWWSIRIKHLIGQENLSVVLCEISVHKSLFQCSGTRENSIEGIYLACGNKGKIL